MQNFLDNIPSSQQLRTVYRSRETAVFSSVQSDLVTCGLYATHRSGAGAVSR